MRDYDGFRKSAIRYWERRRLFYNLALILPAVLGYFLSAMVPAAVGDKSHLGSGAIIALFMVSALGANVCYCFGYALEFIFGSDEPDCRWVSFWRPVSFELGTLVSIALAFVGG